MDGGRPGRILHDQVGCERRWSRISKDVVGESLAVVPIHDTFLDIPARSVAC